VRYAGVSNFNLAQLRRVQAVHPVASLQPPYSMLARGVEAELLPWCAANGIGVIAYSPMQKGLLTGKVTPDRVAQLPADDHRRSDPEFQNPRLAANMELAEGLRRLAEGRGKTAAHLAIAWVLRRPELTAAIVGARKLSQVEETVGAAGWKLLSEDLSAVEALLARRASDG
jgi:aryl-alcohol dehydrogenase-like predicted oxidoreductase